MSHSYIVERVAGVMPTSDVPLYEWDELVDTPLLRNAQDRKSQCAVLFVAFDPERPGEVLYLGTPEDDAQQ